MLLWLRRPWSQTVRKPSDAAYWLCGLGQINFHSLCQFTFLLSGKSTSTFWSDWCAFQMSELCVKWLRVVFGQILKSFVCCVMEFTLFPIRGVNDEAP